MKKKIIYEKNPFGEKVKFGKEVNLDALLGLPTPAEIAASLKTTKVTLALGTRAVDLLKEQAKKQQIPYQVMIRHLVDEYAARLQK